MPCRKVTRPGRSPCKPATRAVGRLGAPPRAGTLPAAAKAADLFDLGGALSETIDDADFAVNGGLRDRVPLSGARVRVRTGPVPGGSQAAAAIGAGLGASMARM